jgi:glycosyltransferase involved in cell wall biosynthesis
MQKIAILIPCFNEELAVGKVIQGFQKSMPEAEIHVFDNASHDRTAEVARAAGAIVHHVAARGKGNVVRAMFRDVDADAYVMVDGDDTYPADLAPELIAPVLRGEAEMVVGTRLQRFESNSFRRFHLFGNGLVRQCINWLFAADLRDVLSGYRAFSRRFVKTMPVLSSGFEIETEMTLHALERRFIVREIEVPYGERPEGSESKLRTFRDGSRVLWTIFRIFKDYRPMPFFGALGALIMGLGIVAGIAVLDEFASRGQVLGLARAALSVGLCLAGLLSITTGLILDTVNQRARELYVLLADQVAGRVPTR